MPLPIHAASPEAVKDLAEKFNSLEAKLASFDIETGTPGIDPDSKEHKTRQKEMDEIRRLYNIAGGASAFDPAFKALETEVAPDAATPSPTGGAAPIAKPAPPAEVHPHQVQGSGAE